MATADHVRRGMWRFLPALVLLVGLGAFYASGFHHYASFEMLREHREMLLQEVAQAPVASAVVYVAVYAMVVALSVPGGAILTVFGGFLFGLYAGTACAVVGATLGASALFFAARSAIGGFLRSRAGPFLARMEAGFRDDAMSYLLVLRLVPLFPFWLVNLVPAALGIPFHTFALATLFGIVPGTFVFASVGSGLGAVLDMGGAPDLSLLFKTEVLLPILGLAALALVPVFYRRVRARRSRT